MPIGELAALTTAVLWCFTSLFFAEAARRVGSLLVNLLRLPVALTLLTLALPASEGALAALDARSVVYLAISGVVGLSIGDLAYFGALQRLGARLSLLLLSLAPIFATATAVFVLGEIPTVLTGAGIVLTLAGVFSVVLERRNGANQQEVSTAGVIRGVIAAACQGIGLVLAKLGMQGQVSPLAASWVRMLVATVAIWLACAAVGKLRARELGSAAQRARWPLLVGAVCGPFLGVWLSMIAARFTDVGVAATIMATNPVLIIPIVMATEGYRPSWRALLGSITAVAGVALLFAK
jgi:drug/metabolite transporter (DMT)-like permease